MRSRADDDDRTKVGNAEFFLSLRKFSISGAGLFHFEIPNGGAELPIPPYHIRPPPEKVPSPGTAAHVKQLQRNTCSNEKLDWQEGMKGWIGNDPVRETLLMPALDENDPLRRPPLCT